MTREQFYRKLLEAHIRGLFVGTFSTHDQLTDDERSVFFTEAVQRGFFVRADAPGETYTNFDDMLADLQNGKKIINLKTTQRPAGYFSFPKDYKDLYTEYENRNADWVNVNEVNLRTSFELGAKRQEVVPHRTRLAEGDAPAVPGGWLSSFWNRIVKTFTGHSSEAWTEYDLYQEESAYKARIAEKEARYALGHKGANPGSVEDEFTERVLKVDREGRIKRGEILAENAVIRPANDDENDVKTKEQKLEDQLQMMSHQEQVEFNAKMAQISKYDIDIYNNFYKLDEKGNRVYRTVDDALAIAKGNFEKANMPRLNREALNNISNEESKMLGDVYATYVWARSKETDELIKNNAYRISEFLRVMKNNKEFTAKVDAEAESMKQRADDIGNVIYYTNHVDFNRHEAEMKLALQALGVDGADKFEYMIDKQIAAFNEEYAKHELPAKPVYDDKLLEEKLQGGTITQEELDHLIEQEQTIRGKYSYYDEKTDTMIRRELMPASEFRYDFQLHGLLTGDKLQDDIMTLKMMREQHAAIDRGEEIPFLFRNEEEVRKSIEKGKALGIIGQAVKVPELPDEEDPEPEPDPEEEKRRAEEERIRQEEERAAQEREQKLYAKDAFLKQNNPNPKDGDAINEYNRLSKLIDSYLNGHGTILRELAKEAQVSLDRVVDAKFGLVEYTPETALEDIKTLVILSECAKDLNFRERYTKHPTDIEKDIAANIERNKMHKSLLGNEEERKVDMIFFRKNSLGPQKRAMSVSDLYKGILALEKEKIQEAAKKSVEETLKGYSKNQREILLDTEKMEQISAMMKLPDLPMPMSKEETQLQQQAVFALSSIYSDVLMKPQDSDENINVNDLTDHLTSIAMYQSLSNKDFRKAYITLLASAKTEGLDPKLAEGFREKYREMIKGQLNTSEILPRIISDRSRAVEFVFTKGTTLFRSIEQRNMRKGIQLDQYVNMELSQISGTEKSLDKAYSDYRKKNGKSAANEHFSKDYADLKITKAVMNDVCKTLKAGVKTEKKEIETAAKSMAAPSAK